MRRGGGERREKVTDDAGLGVEAAAVSALTQEADAGGREFKACFSFLVKTCLLLMDPFSNADLLLTSCIQ